MGCSFGYDRVIQRDGEANAREVVGDRQRVCCVLQEGVVEQKMESMLRMCWICDDEQRHGISKQVYKEYDGIQETLGFGYLGESGLGNI